MEIAPYPLTLPQDELPTGSFMLPVCISRDELAELMQALKRAQIYGEQPITAYWSILEALAFVEDPTNAPCYPKEEQDTIAEDPASFIDNVLEHLYEGGVFSALGYVIQEAGSIVMETALRLVSTYVFGDALGGIVYVLIDGILSGEIPINPAEYVEIIIDTLTEDLKTVTFQFVGATA